MKPQHIYWFAYFNKESPSVRYRGTYVLAHLHKTENISYDIIYPSYEIKAIWYFLKVYFSALFFRKNDSLIVIQRLYTNRIYAKLLKLLVLVQRKNTWFDLDDAEYEEQPTTTLNFFIKNCEVCTVGSTGLLQYCKQLNTNVVLITSPVTNHVFYKQKRNKILTIGWIGCFWGGHRNSLFELFFPALFNLPFPIRLQIIGARNNTAKQELIHFLATEKNITIEFPTINNWEAEAPIYNLIKAFDIGISPLLNTEINRCKSAYKLKQYMSCAVPVLASPIGENVRFLKEGINGYFCKDVAAFKQQITAFNQMDNHNYWQLSANAKQSIPQFSLDKITQQILQTYREYNLSNK